MSDWLEHVKKTMKKFPGLKLKDVLKKAKTTYKKGVNKVHKKSHKKTHHKKTQHKKTQHKKTHKRTHKRTQHRKK